MKKKIYTISSAPTGRIWRHPTKPLVEPTIEIPEQYQYLLTDEEKGKESNTDRIKILEKYNINTPQYFEYNSNKIENYITGNTFNFPTEILKEYPEYLAGWEIIITNTALVCFYDSSKDENNFVIYDMFDDDINEDTEKDGFLDNIKPDISMLKMYDMFEQPLSVRKINFTNNEFTAERSYVYNNKWCGFFNCDGINYGTGGGTILTGLNDNFFFETTAQSKPTINYIQFNYKPLFLFKIYNTDGKKNSNTKIRVKIGSTDFEIQQENPIDPGVYFVDLSNTTNLDKVSVYLDSENTTINGYLEVI